MQNLKRILGGLDLIACFLEVSVLVSSMSRPASLVVASVIQVPWKQNRHLVCSFPSSVRANNGTQISFQSYAPTLTVALMIGFPFPCLNYISLKAV